MGLLGRSVKFEFLGGKGNLNWLGLGLGEGWEWRGWVSGGAWVMGWVERVCGFRLGFVWR